MWCVRLSTQAIASPISPFNSEKCAIPNSYFECVHSDGNARVWGSRGWSKEKQWMIIMTVNKAFRRPIFLIIYFLCTYNVEIEISVRDTNFNDIIHEAYWRLNAKTAAREKRTEPKSIASAAAATQKKRKMAKKNHHHCHFIIIRRVLFSLIGESKALSALSLENVIEWWENQIDRQTGQAKEGDSDGTWWAQATEQTKGKKKWTATTSSS